MCNPIHAHIPVPIPLPKLLGRPIIVPKIEQPTDEEVLKYHTMFIDEMYRIFYTY
ncbi:hypothetical protein EON63_20145, partial [archaeon]